MIVDAIICSDHDVPLPTTSEDHCHAEGLVVGVRPTTSISRPRPLPAREQVVYSDETVFWSLRPDSASQACAGRPGPHLTGCRRRPTNPHHASDHLQSTTLTGTVAPLPVTLIASCRSLHNV
ncbi:hypothetical protein TIFTF001_048923 [Ficus carica]|uniref:Uncharacterized protein n=1 Tax=Ficus carica TaxID=3494 RepID=A0AA87Z9C4_FICCA|nr:hypothetical protein TIFTF001_048923 [Ficus carica]